MGKEERENENEKHRQQTNQPANPPLLQTARHQTRDTQCKPQLQPPNPSFHRHAGCISGCRSPQVPRPEIGKIAVFIEHGIVGTDVAHVAAERPEPRISLDIIEPVQILDTCVEKTVCFLPTFFLYAMSVVSNIFQPCLLQPIGDGVVKGRRAPTSSDAQMRTP